MIDPSEISDILKQQLDGLKDKASFEEVSTLSETVRGAGGFGSTGNN